MAKPKDASLGSDFSRTITLSDCVDILDSRRIPVNSSERASRQGTVPYYGATGQVGWIDDYLFDEELLLLGEDGAPFHDKSKPISYIISGKSWVNNHAHVLRARRAMTSNQFLKHYLDAFDFTDYVQGSTRDKLTQGAMKTIPVVLPSIATQDAIVHHLDGVLKTQSSSLQHLDAAGRAFGKLRSALLAAASSGFLTSDWRDNRPTDGAAGDAWTEVLLKDVVRTIRGGSTEVPQLEQTEFPVLRSSSVRPFTVDYDDVRFLTGEQSRSPDNFLVEQDLLITRLSGSIEYVGNCAQVRGLAGRRIQYPDRLFCCRLRDPREAPFLEVAFAGPAVRRQIEAASRSAAGHQRISIRDIQAFRVLRPPLDEQTEIVSRIRAIMDIIASLEARITIAAHRAESSRRSLLAMALRGELVAKATRADLSRGTA